MKGMIKFAAVALAGILMAGCGERVEVPPGFSAKLVTKDGYQEGLIPTSKFRLPACLTYCDRLVLLDGTDKSYVEPMTIFIPKDKLNITVDVRATLSVAPQRTESLFASLAAAASPGAQGGSVSTISSDVIYNTYGKQILQAEVRAYLTQYSIAEIASSNEKINADLQQILQKVMSERTPFNIRYAGLTNIKFPEIITKAQENSAQRREMIQQEEAQLEVSRVKLERELKEAQLQRAIEKEKAETEAIKQREISASITPQYLRAKELEIEEIKARAWNGVGPQTLIQGDGKGNQLIMDMRKQ